MKVKRALFLFLVFFVSFIFSLYFTFPFERFAEKVLYEKGFRPVNLSFRHFPPELFIEELPFKGVTLKNVSISPLSFSKFRLNSELCGGRLSAVFNYPIEELTFKLKGVKLSNCPLILNQAKLDGNLGGEGSLTFKGRYLTGGKGEFKLYRVKLKDVNFGLFSFKELNLGDGKVEYRVDTKDYVKVSGKLKGEDAELTVNGGVNYNPQNYLNSYVNLVFSVSMKSGKFAGRKFNFTVRGNVNSLRFY